MKEWFERPVGTSDVRSGFLQSSGLPHGGNGVKGPKGQGSAYQRAVGQRELVDPRPARTRVGRLSASHS